MQAYEQTAVSTTIQPRKIWKLFFDNIYSILKRTHMENVLYQIKNLDQSIIFNNEGDSNGELAFLDTLLKYNNGNISEYIYRKPTYIDQYLR